MNRDSLWKAIQDGLNRHIDHDNFERCTQDILREVYPTLVPVVGGSDAGMDGAIATEEQPMPLIVTTEKNVIGNFRKSVENHLKRRAGPQQCVLATSRRLTPKRRDNILDTAKKLGVRLVQVHDQEDIVGRLYRNPKWRSELLGITGEIPALSSLPPRPRSGNAEIIIGREGNLNWLRSTSGDLLVVGQPGSGKTYLHLHMANRGEAFFLVSDISGRVADEVRSLKPRVIVVDDAHVCLDRLDALRRMRLEIGADFAIHANCWPNEEKKVRERLAITSSQVHWLDLLPQKKIRELIEHLGIVGPDSLLQLLIMQSEGKPGLTAALVEACKRGELNKVWSGDVLADSLLADRQLMRDQIDLAILATFALGGDAGIGVNEVMHLLAMSLPELRNRLATLGAGGIITELANDTLTVRPAAVRGVVVREYFFGGLGKPDFRTSLQHVRRRSDALHVLLDARQRGANIPLNYLEQAVTETNAPDLWEHFAWLGEAECEAILDDHSSAIVNAADGLLHFQPTKALQALMLADLNTSDLEKRTDRPLQRIKNWLCPWEEYRETVRRREMALKQLESLISSDIADMRKIVEYLAAILEPGLEGHATRPGEPFTVQLRRGVLPLDLLQGIIELWPRIMILLEIVSGNLWAKLLQQISRWIWPSQNTFGQGIDDKIYAFMRSAGAQMLTDLVKSPMCSGLARTKIRWIVTNGKLNVDVGPETRFDLFFSDHNYGTDWRKETEVGERKMAQFAAELLPHGPVSVARYLESIEQEVVEFGDMHGGRQWMLYVAIAEQCDDPSAWLSAFIDTSIPARYMQPFIGMIAQKQTRKLEHHLGDWLERDEYRELAIQIILQADEISDPLRDRAIALTDLGGSGDFRFSSEKISSAVMARLLTHSNDEVAASAALGEWMRGNQHMVRAELLESWKQAVLKIKGHYSHWLLEIFAKHPDVAFSWAEARIKDSEAWLWKSKDGILAAAKSLPKESRRKLVLLMAAESQFDDDCFNALVSSDLDLFREWFAKQQGKHSRMYPLRRRPDERWEQLATIAVDEGATAQDLADYIGPSSDSWSGPDSAHYRSYIGLFERLRDHENPAFHLAGEKGLEWALANVERAEKLEKHEAVFGR